VIGAVIGVVALIILRIRVAADEKKNMKYRSFLLMEGLWFIAGVILGPICRGTGIFDGSLLSLGLIFLLADGFGVLAVYLRR
jgi:hypothetical protein